MPIALPDVRFRGQSRHDILRCECLLLTQSGHPKFHVKRITTFCGANVWVEAVLGGARAPCNQIATPVLILTRLCNG